MFFSTYYQFPESYLACSFPRNILSPSTQQIDMGHVSFIDQALNSSQSYSSTGISYSCDLPALSAGISTITLLRHAVIDATLDQYPEQNMGGGNIAVGFTKICWMLIWIVQFMADPGFGIIIRVENCDFHVRAQVLFDDKGSAKSPIAHLARGLSSLLLTRGQLDSRVTHEGPVWGNVSGRALSRIPSVGAHTGEGSVTVTSWPWLTPVLSGMYHPAARQEENNLSNGTSGLAPLPQHTHAHTRMLPIIPRVLHSCSTVFPLSRWAGRTKGHILLTIWKYTLSKFSFIAFIYLRQSSLNMFAIFQKYLELHSASV